MNVTLSNFLKEFLKRKLKLGHLNISSIRNKFDIINDNDETSKRLRNYRQQKNIDFVGNSNIIVDCLGNKKLHLSKRRNFLLAKNILKYLRDFFQNVTFSSCAVEFDECEFDLLCKTGLQKKCQNGQCTWPFKY